MSFGPNPVFEQPFNYSLESCPKKKPNKQSYIHMSPNSISQTESVFLPDKISNKLIFKICLDGYFFMVLNRLILNQLAFIYFQRINSVKLILSHSKNPMEHHIFQILSGITDRALSYFLIIIQRLKENLGLEVSDDNDIVMGAL